MEAGKPPVIMPLLPCGALVLQWSVHLVYKAVNMVFTWPGLVGCPDAWGASGMGKHPSGPVPHGPLARSDHPNDGRVVMLAEGRVDVETGLTRLPTHTP
jgi:hypothetical protein